MGVDRVFKHLFYPVNGFFLAEILVGIEPGFPVTSGFNLAVLVPKVMTRHKAVYALKKRFGRNGVLERKIGVQSLSVESLYKIRVLQNALDLACINKILADLTIVHGLDAKEIARDKNRVVNGVVDRKAEHAPQPWEQILLPFLKAVNQHLAVGVGAKAVTL